MLSPVVSALSQLTTDVSLTSVARGDVLYRGASKWNNLAAGTSGHFLKSNGAGADPSWAAASASPAGSSGQLQYNNAGAFGGAAFSAVATSGTLLTLTGLANSDILLALKSFSGSATGNLLQAFNLAGSVRGRILVAGDFSNTGGQTSSEIFGAGASVGGEYSLAIGSSASAAGAFCVAIGETAVAGTASLNNAVAIGRGASAAVADAIAIGQAATVTGSGGMAIGKGSSAGANTTLVGPGASATSTDSTSLGQGSSCTGIRATAVGKSATAAAEAMALGTSSSAAGTSAVALGRSASAGHTNAIAIGRGVTSGAVDTINLGTVTGTSIAPTVILWGASSTQTARETLSIVESWATATDASRKSRSVFNQYDTAARECLRLEASGTAAMIGFLGASAVIRQATTGTTTGFTAGSGTAVNDDSTFTGNTGSTAYTIGDIILALKNYGLLAA